MEEKSIDIPVRNEKTLKGIIYPAGSKKMVIICHGFTGDKTEWGRFPKTAARLNEHRIDALIFDFTGSGENARVPVCLSQQVKDLEDVFEWVKEQGYTSIGTIGLSFGGITSLLANLPERKVAVFWAPGFYIKRIIGKIRLFFAKLLAKRKPMKRASRTGAILMGEKFFKDIESTEVEPVLKSFTTPSLIIQGTSDATVKPSYSREAIALMPQDEHHKLVEVEGAGHDFGMDNPAELDTFINESIKWMEKYM
ncbi:MAG: alpha/beta hydrolase family protein [Candidatus Hodarchaeota archaeon]